MKTHQVLAAPGTMVLWTQQGTLALHRVEIPLLPPSQMHISEWSGLLFFNWWGINPMIVVCPLQCSHCSETLAFSKVQAKLVWCLQLSKPVRCKLLERKLFQYGLEWVLRLLWVWSSTHHHLALIIRMLLRQRPKQWFWRLRWSLVSVVKGC